MRTSILLATVLIGVGLLPVNIGAQSAASLPLSPTPAIPVEDFLRDADFEDVTLSPDGKRMALIARHRGRANLGVIDLDSRKLYWITNLEKYDVYSYQWLGNDRVSLITVDSLDDATGNIYLRGSFAVDIDGSGKREMGGFQVIRESVEKPGSVLVLAAGRTRFPEVYRLDTRTGQKELLTFENPGEVVSWVVDRKDEVRVAVSRDKNTVKIHYRENQKAPWIKVEEYDAREFTLQPLSFDYDHRTLYVRSNKGRSKAALFKYDFEKKALGERVAESENFDIGGMRFDTAKKKLVGINTGTERGTRTLSGVRWLDPEWEAVQKRVDEALPMRVNHLSWGSATPHRVLISSRSDTYPGGFFLLDTRTNKMEKLAESREWIDAAKMAPMKRVQYKARDGLTIPALLTLPKDANGNALKNAPLVVEIHGGPHVHGGAWGFDPTAQFLASRGYAVLQPAFRGSTGYGRAFLEAGFKQWGLAMQDDITDGVHWAVKEGHADAKRVCLMGGSYGGYAALYGLIKEQGMFRCGIGAVAVTDLELLFTVSWSDTFRSEDAQDSMKARIGDLKTDADHFRKISPLHQADKISAPVLLAFGSDDVRVPLIHGQKFRDALDLHKKPYEWVVYKSEGHGFNKRENRIDYFKRIEAFLDKHLRQVP